MKSNIFRNKVSNKQTGNTEAGFICELLCIVLGIVFVVFIVFLLIVIIAISALVSSISGTPKVPDKTINTPYTRNDDSIELINHKFIEVQEKPKGSVPYTVNNTDGKGSALQTITDEIEMQQTWEYNSEISAQIGAEVGADYKIISAKIEGMLAIKYGKKEQISRSRKITNSTQVTVVPGEIRKYRAFKYEIWEQWILVVRLKNGEIREIPYSFLSGEKSDIKPDTQ